MRWEKGFLRKSSLQNKSMHVRRMQLSYFNAHFYLIFVICFAFGARSIFLTFCVSWWAMHFRHTLHALTWGKIGDRSYMQFQCITIEKRPKIAKITGNLYHHWITGIQQTTWKFAGIVNISENPRKMYLWWKILTIFSWNSSKNWMYCKMQSSAWVSILLCGFYQFSLLSEAVFQEYAKSSVSLSLSFFHSIVHCCVSDTANIVVLVWD